MQIEGSNNGGSEQGSSSSSDIGQIVLALIKDVNDLKMMRKEFEVMVIRTVQQVIGPVVEELTRKVIKEQIHKFFTGGNRNHEDEIIISRERNLQLKFLDDEVCDPVLTGKEIKGKGDTPIRVALVDTITDQVVVCGPESSAKVEILVLDSSGEDEHNLNLENFNDMIISEGDKEKPHFAKCKYIHLKEGIGFLENIKLGHDKNHMKNCTCRLGARMVRNFDGIKVQEAWTKSFTVMDKRNKHNKETSVSSWFHFAEYEKSNRPSLSDEIWRLKNIAKDGAPRDRLNKMNILTVEDFLFLHSVDPERLQKIAAGAKGKTTLAKWNATVDHAQTCIIDDNKIYRYPHSSESETAVTFDVVGGLKGLIHDSHYVPINNLSEVEKAHARELLRSAYENRKDLCFFVDEASLLQEFPYKSSDINGCYRATSETIDIYDRTEPGTSHQSITPTINHSVSIVPITTGQSHVPHMEPGTSCQSITPTVNHSGSIVPITMGQSHHPQLEAPSVSNLEPGTASQRINTFVRLNSFGLITVGPLYEPHLPDHGSSSSSLDLDPFLERFGDNDNLMAVIFPETNNAPQTLEAESHSHQQSNATRIHSVEVMDAIIWMARAGQRFMAQRNIRVRKRRRIHEKVAYGRLA
ncbi:hypothetical protein BUALT_Bualt07G0041900 [Buddleja alternifolia]|uniref:Calmodulin-binding protein n=1 Tax=Buddleja alternifolia TaxID=168488 RepID=A0AAV6XES0_9LAMI|nr:hypothetical protein BUALT_Bualt07G0041900 [Buddleja alternifolia]